MVCVCLNIIVKTRSSDAYKLVAINKFPIIGRGASLEDILGSAAIEDWINNTIISKDTYDNAMFYIRNIDGGEDLIYPVSRYVEWRK